MAEQYQNDLQIELDLKAKDVINTLPDFSKKFFNHLKNKNMSQRTRLQYAYDMRRFFDWLSNQAGFKNVNIMTSTASEILDKLTYDDIQEYLETLDYYEDSDGNKKISSPSAKARKISSLRSFYKFYFKIHEIKNNLADLMELPKIPDKSIITMDSSQSNRLLNIVFDTTGMSNAEIIRHDKVAKRDYAIMMLFLGTGIRVSELVGADLNDIDFHNASLLVTRKGGDQDEVFLNAQVLNALEDYLESDRDALLKENDSPALFISMHSKRISVRNVEMLIKTYESWIKL